MHTLHHARRQRCTHDASTAGNTHGCTRTHSTTLRPTAQRDEAGWGWRGHSEISPLWGPNTPATVCPAVCPSTHLWTPPSPDVCEVGTEPGLLMQLSLSSGSLSLCLCCPICLSASISKYLHLLMSLFLVSVLSISLLVSLCFCLLIAHPLHPSPLGWGLTSCFDFSKLLRLPREPPQALHPPPQPLHPSPSPPTSP